MTWRQELDDLELGQRVAQQFAEQALADEIGALRANYVTTQVARTVDHLCGNFSAWQVTVWERDAARRWDTAHPHLSAHWRRHRRGAA